MKNLIKGHIEIVGYVWYNSGRSCIGIVLIADHIKKSLRAYIDYADGVDEDQDMIRIMEWGAKFQPDAALICIEGSGVVLNKELILKTKNNKDENN